VSAPPTPDAGRQSQHCITCGDVGDPSTVVAVDGDRELALCAGPDGERTTVEIALVSPVAAGDVLLVHAGTAIARLDDLAVRS
jgi:hydrogenase maturation factor